MKRNQYLIAFLSLVMLSLSATGLAKTKDAEELEIAENIERNSQQVAKWYFYKNQNIMAHRSKKELQASIESLKANIEAIKGYKEDDIQENLIQFIDITYSELYQTINQPFNEENANLVIDYSEALLESAEFIVEKHAVSNTEDEKKYVQLKKMELLIERANKYYIAVRSNFADENSLNQVRLNIEAFEYLLNDISKFKYQNYERSALTSLTKYWDICKPFYLGTKSSSLPRIVLASTKYLDDSVETLAKYHLKKMK